MRKRVKSPSDVDASDGAVGANSLFRGFEILRCFQPSDTTLGNQELIDRTGMPKATVSRLTFALASQGYLDYHENIGRYSIGAATVSLGYSALSAMPVVKLAGPLLQRLADKTSVSGAIGGRDRHSMTYLAHFRGPSPVALQLGVGSLLPIWRTSMGLGYVVGLSEEARSSLRLELAEAEPERCAQIDRAFDDALESHARHGYVCCIGTWFSYVNSIGIPFQPTDGTSMVALTCGGIADILTREACLGSAGAALLETVELLRARLEGHSHTTPA